MEKEYNKFGVGVIKCCASCKHNNEPKTDRKRICVFGRIVDMTDICSQWKMKTVFENAGKGGGKVKSPKYWKWAMREENRCLSISELHHAYEKEFGNIFLDF